MVWPPSTVTIASGVVEVLTLASFIAVMKLENLIPKKKDIKEQSNWIRATQQGRKVKAAKHFLRDALAIGSLQVLRDEGAESQAQDNCEEFVKRWEEACEAQTSIHLRQKVFSSVRGKLWLCLPLVLVLGIGTALWPAWESFWLGAACALLAAQFLSVGILNWIGNAIEREHGKSEYLSKDTS